MVVIVFLLFSTFLIVSQTHLALQVDTWQKEEQEKRVEISIFLSSVLSLSNLQPEEVHTQECYNVVSVSGPLWYSTLEVENLSDCVGTSLLQLSTAGVSFHFYYTFSSFCALLLLCLCSHLCPWLLHLSSPSTLFLLIFCLNNHPPPPSHHHTALDSTE